jgi:hypothetical protein
MPNNILLGLGGGVFILTMGVIVWLSLSNAHLKVELAQLQSVLTGCQFANRDFQFEIEKQNKIVAGIETKSVEQEKRAAGIIRQAQKFSDQYKKAAEQLLKQQPASDACVAADQLLSDYLSRRP